MLDGGFQPKISDCRDLFQEVMDKPYHHSISLMEILRHIVEFDTKLHHMNEVFQQMQKIGMFRLGEKYFYNEIKELYSSLLLFKDFK